MSSHFFRLIFLSYSKIFVILQKNIVEHGKRVFFQGNTTAHTTIQDAKTHIRDIITFFAEHQPCGLQAGNEQQGGGAKLPLHRGSRFGDGRRLGGKGTFAHTHYHQLRSNRHHIADRRRHCALPSGI